MAYSNRKPYYDLEMSQREFFGGSTRFLKQALDKESQYEKPYLDLEYPSMQLEIPKPTWPSRIPEWLPGSLSGLLGRLPSRRVGTFGKIAESRLVRLVRFFFPSPRCSIVSASDTPRFGLDCGETTILTFWEPDSFFVQRWRWTFTLTSVDVNIAMITFEELGETHFGYAVALTAKSEVGKAEGTVLVCGIATTSNVPRIWTTRFGEGEPTSLFARSQVFNQVLSVPGIVRCCREVEFNCDFQPKIYPNYDFFIYNEGTGTWSSVHDATSGDSFTDSTYIGISVGDDAGVKAIERGFLCFDLSALLPGYIIDSCSLHCYLQSGGSPVNTATTIVQEGTFPIPASVADFDSFTGSSFGEITASGLSWSWIEISFNAAGIAYIQSVLGGNAKLCVREYDHDYLDVIPPDESYAITDIKSKETSNPPYLKLTYL